MTKFNPNSNKSAFRENWTDISIAYRDFFICTQQLLVELVITINYVVIVNFSVGFCNEGCFV
jgi:hypothetical protein